MHGHLKRSCLRLLRAGASVLALAIAPGVACAWGHVGHQAVGAVADQLLTPAARAAVAELLIGDLDGSRRPSNRHSLPDIADWADEIRGQEGDHPRWHFDNQPICRHDPSAAAWCARGECASAKFDAELAILADDGRSRAERNEALKWVVHLAGDLHQPLHAADFAEGGNLIHVAAHGRPQSGHGGRRGETLHAFWDTRLVTLALHPSRGSIPARSMQRLLQRAQAEDPAELSKTPAQWAAESNELARSVALNIDGIGCGMEYAGRFPTVTLTDDYVASAKQIVEQRLALAGARLAQALNQALGENP